ncbi:sigma factor-like helix-turn-helix DNA-binding protein [Streptomyces sp. NPDC047043]|uniref:sigma factor-like helix-turn-helix DNA-binding protein n=1 Tax=Streptomyces sp. NPDC047043 TaxID=3154497 RepID=UPI0033C4A82B
MCARWRRVPRNDVDFHVRRCLVRGHLRRLRGRRAARRRAVLVLRIREGLADAEIAQLLGCSVGAVRAHARHGLKAVGADPRRLREVYARAAERAVAHRVRADGGGGGLGRRHEGGRLRTPTAVSGGRCGVAVRGKRRSCGCPGRWHGGQPCRRTVRTSRLPFGLPGVKARVSRACEPPPCRPPSAAGPRRPWGSTALVRRVVHVPVPGYGSVSSGPGTRLSLCVPCPCACTSLRVAGGVDQPRWKNSTSARAS